jgi:hypothetical protein
LLVQLKTKNAIQIMDGDSPVEKMINFYLTNVFISQTEALSDECLDYAQDFVNNDYTKEQIAFILFSSFGVEFTPDGEPLIRDSKSFDLAASHINILLSKSK